MTDPKPRPLRRREIQVITLNARGLRAQQIADDLGISERTVRSYVLDASRTLGITGSVLPALVEYAYAHGLITVDRRRAPVALPPSLAATLDCAARGLGHRGVAAELGITPMSARSYRSRLLKALDAISTAHAVAIAWEMGLRPPPDRMEDALPITSAEVSAIQEALLTRLYAGRDAVPELHLILRGPDGVRLTLVAVEDMLWKTTVIAGVVSRLAAVMAQKRRNPDGSHPAVPQPGALIGVALRHDVQEPDCDDRAPRSRQALRRFMAVDLNGGLYLAGSALPGMPGDEAPAPQLIYRRQGDPRRDEISTGALDACAALLHTLTPVPVGGTL
ncbi:LuxR C-terminal-related transcriptional regulator [Streptomyces griseoluteus]|uniref:LuxR C-terminal-related transcriptional regulator n=1 Tax=Streptomyces griseoluteus TaxID=29306 RepID=UPI003816BF74